METYCCATCHAAPAGFGWVEPVSRRANRFGQSPALMPEKRKPKRFCSMDCQSLFTDAMQRGLPVNREQLDNQAKHDALMALGDYVMHVGLNRSMADYTPDQAQGLVECVLHAYQQSLKTHFPKER